MAGELPPVVATFVGDVQGLLDQISTLREALASTSEAAAPLDEALGGLDDSATVAAEAMARVDAATKEMDDALALVASTTRAAGASLDDIAAAEDLAATATERYTAAVGELDTALATQKTALAESAAATDATTASASTAAASTDTAAASAGAASGKYKMVALAAIVAAGASIKMAGDFQEATTQLVTGAGESESQMGMLRQGILAMSVATDTSVTQLTQGLYMISSAGIHGAAGLKVLEAAAKGAKEGDAQLGDVASAVTSVLNAYHLSASQAAGVTQQLTNTVSSGKMHMADLARSISAVLPVAASAHISFQQVGAAIATMTMQGTTARRASMNLATTIKSLLNPSAAAAQEMKDLGISANEVSTHLGSAGLTGTLSQLTAAILNNMKGGTVLASTYKQMTPATQQFANSLAAGKMTSQDFTDAIKGLTVQQADLLTKFKASAVGATGLKQTYTAALAKMVGGSAQLNVALQLTGQNMATFKGNVASIKDPIEAAKQSQDSWKVVTEDFNFQMGQAKQGLIAVAISVGQVLLPAFEKILKPIVAVVQALVECKPAAIAVGILVIALTALFGTLKLVALAQAAVNLVMDANPIVLIILAIAALVIALIYLVNHCKAFRDFWIDAWNDVRDVTMAVVDALTGAWRAFIGGIESIASAGWKKISGFFTGAFDDVEHALNAFADFFTDHWRGILTVLLAIVTSGLSLLVTVIASHWDTIQTGVNNFTNSVVSFFEQLPGRIVAALASLGGDLLSIGYNVVMGLLHGIENAAGAVIGYVEGLAHDISHAFSSVLSIFSPSRVFMEHGRNIVLGLIAGIQGARSAVLSTVGSLGNAISGSMAGSSAYAVAVGGGNGAPAGAAGAASGGNVTIAVDGTPLFTMLKSQLFNYNVNNGGTATGQFIPK